MSITVKELAKMLNLSEAAVSLALRNKPGVSTQTRRKVMDLADKHGYDFSRPSKNGMQSRHITFAIYKRQGAVVGETPFFSELFEGIEIACANEQYKLHITHIIRGDEVEKKIDEISYSDCAGIILLGTEMQTEDFAPFANLKLPVVVLDLFLDFIEYDCVLINNVQGALIATDYLIHQTNKQPGYLRSSYSIGNFEDRADGFYKAVRRHGMSTSKSIVHRLTPSVEGACADMLELMEQGEELASCYFADNDWIAIGAIKAFQQRGKRIPEDIAVIGFDNIPLAAYMEPALTTIHVPKKYMGEMAVSRLISNIRSGAHTPVKIEIATSLKKRRTV
ncbi:MAG: LacI family DNA-binding transcriptional regulator [Oscillospiraceae bacterium]|nr:LacI family DNA-binding transcriptional regulator [Oscillospiraceae bacterium]MCL2279818.1 LacI family DNA-binding transcriptional regulator [Oscillospiraceae bacterium]